MKALPRPVGAALSERLRVMPAVVVTGARQTDKSTLVEHWSPAPVAMQRSMISTCSMLSNEAEEPDGAHLENLVLHDLLAWRDARVERAELGYWRTSICEEVDFVIEAGGKLLRIEVKSTSRRRLADATHLRTFRAEYGKKARAGLLLHTGSTLEWLAPDVPAAPGWKVL